MRRMCPGVPGLAERVPSSGQSSLLTTGRPGKRIIADQSKTSSRKSASLWLCHVHNLVNARLGKPEFDCLTLDATYDCGCGPEGNATSSDGAETAGAGAGAAATAMLPHEDWERDSTPTSA